MASAKQPRLRLALPCTPSAQLSRRSRARSHHTRRGHVLCVGLVPRRFPPARRETPQVDDRANRVELRLSFHL
eukprot:6091434-Prymnesium_polylepis.1